MNYQAWKQPLALLATAGSLFVLAASSAGAEEQVASPSDTQQVTETAADSVAAESGEQPASEDSKAQAPKTQTLLVNEKHLQLVVPARWKMVKPRNNIIELELSIAPLDEKEPAPVDPSDESMQPLRGRLTMMAAGGDVDSNIRRWVGQFRLGRDADGKDAMRRDRRRLRGAVAHVLDIAGTYFDSPEGPRGPKVELPDYRMLAAIIEVEGAGRYYVKFYGPAKIVDENREAFEEMLSSLEVVEAPSEEPMPEAESEVETAKS